MSGTCLCPEGYIGSACETEDVPQQMLLTAMTLSRFPSTISRNGKWDVDGGPDIYFTLDKGDSTLYTQHTFVENAESGKRYTFENLEIDLDFPQHWYKITLYDSDNPKTDQMMGALEFSPYQRGQGFPSEITLSDGGFELVLKVEYRFGN